MLLNRKRIKSLWKNTISVVNTMTNALTGTAMTTADIIIVSLSSLEQIEMSKIYTPAEMRLFFLFFSYNCQKWGAEKCKWHDLVASFE